MRYERALCPYCHHEVTAFEPASYARVDGAIVTQHLPGLRLCRHKAGTHGVCVGSGRVIERPHSEAHEN